MVNTTLANDFVKSTSARLTEQRKHACDGEAAPASPRPGGAPPCAPKAAPLLDLRKARGTRAGHSAARGKKTRREVAMLSSCAVEIPAFAPSIFCRQLLHLQSQRTQRVGTTQVPLLGCSQLTTLVCVVVSNLRNKQTTWHIYGRICRLSDHSPNAPRQTRPGGHGVCRPSS